MDTTKTINELEREFADWEAASDEDWIEDTEEEMKWQQELAYPQSSRLDDLAEIALNESQQGITMSIE